MGSVFRELARLRLRALAFGGVSLLARTVLGQPEVPQFSLNWSAPEECPNEAALRAEVLRLAPEAAQGVPGFSAKGSVTRGETGYELELATVYGERHGSRRVQDPSCTELTRAAAVVIALAIRPESAAPDTAAVGAPGAASAAAAASAPAPAPAGDPAPAPTGTAPTAPPSAPAPPPKAPSTTQQKKPFELWVSAGFAGELGTLPGFAPGVTFGVEGRTDWVRFGVNAELLPTQKTSPAEPDGPSLAVDYFGADAFGCLGFLGQKFAPGACAGLGVGRLRGRSRGAPIPGEGSTLWVTPRVGAFVLYRVLPVLTLEGSAHARFALKEASFTIENYGPVYETDPLALVLVFAASLRIW